jgi:hypothetical protein
MVQGLMLGVVAVMVLWVRALLPGLKAHRQCPEGAWHRLILHVYTVVRVLVLRALVVVAVTMMDPRAMFVVVLVLVMVQRVVVWVAQRHQRQTPTTAWG